MNDISWKQLTLAAAAAQQRAYAPYSKYRVGAAIVTSSGRIFAGCNVENASYGLCLCAERGAVAAMVSAGERELAALVVMTQGPEPGAPCGLCRQTLSEFARELPIGLAITGDETPRVHKALSQLFPEPFRGELVTG